MNTFPRCIPIYIEQRYICARKVYIKSLYADVNSPVTSIGTCTKFSTGRFGRVVRSTTGRPKKAMMCKVVGYYT